MDRRSGGFRYWLLVPFIGYLIAFEGYFHFLRGSLETTETLIESFRTMYELP